MHWKTLSIIRYKDCLIKIFKKIQEADSCEALNIDWIQFCPSYRIDANEDDGR